MKINRIKNLRAKWNCRTFEINHHVNDQHHAQERRFKWQMMNRVNQNNQISSKSLFDDRQINHFLRSRHEKKILFRSSSTNWNNRLCYEAKIDHEWKKLILKSFSIVLVKYEKNHIYRMLRLNEIIYRVSLIIWTKKKHSYDVEISIETSSKRSILESFNSSTKRQILKSNSITIFISIQIFQTKTSSLSLSSSIIEINTSFSDFVSMISLAFNSLKRHFELRYRLNSSDSLNLLIMKCMQNVTNFQHVLQSRSYKEIMNDLNRDEWLKIMKNENKSLLTNEIWTLTNSFKNKRVFRDKWVYKIKKKRHDEILRHQTRWMIRDFEQIERFEYTKTFVLMIKSMKYKTMYVIIAINDWKIEQMNVKTTFCTTKFTKTSSLYNSRKLNKKSTRSAN
jgi:hypothetical protein